MDATAFAFGFAASLLSALLVGSVPAVKCIRGHLAAGLHASGRSVSASREQHRTRSTLVALQIALAFVLMVSTGLMIRTFEALTAVDPGFTRPTEVLEFGIMMRGPEAADAAASTRSKQEMFDRIARVPGVTSVAFATTPPLGGGRDTFTDLLVPEADGFSEDKGPQTHRFKFVSPDFFTTAGTALIVGRDVTWMDAYETRPVALVSENLARLAWGSPTAALGKRLRGGSNADDWREIIGVAADVRDDGMAQPAPGIVYVPAMASRIFNAPTTVAPAIVTFLVRSPRTGTASFLDEVRAAVWSVNPQLPLVNTRTLADDYDRSLERTSLTLVLLMSAGALALAIGVVGIYGVLAYVVSQRRREIGIRSALGADPRRLQKMFLQHGLTLCGVGVVVGIIVAAASGRLMSSLLYGVGSLDPVVYAAALGIMIAATALASYVPARRAASVNPIETLRAE
jgi:predicted permease